MSYGGMFTDANGVPFYIDGTLPLRLTDVRTHTSQPNAGFFDLYPNDGAIRFCFISATGPGYHYITQDRTHGTNWILTSGVAMGVTITAYIFSYAIETHLPDYGMAIWNSSGQLVITNETKLLSGVQQLGTAGVEASSGMSFKTTLSGHWAIAPTITGGIVGVVYQGSQAHPYSNFFYASAYYNGSTTLIDSRGVGGDASGGGNLTRTNLRNQIYAIDVSKF